MKNQSIVKFDNDADFDKLNLYNKEDLEAFEFMVKKMLGSNKSGISSVADAVAIAIRAKSLNISWASAIENMHVVNGKTGLNVHLIKALLLRAGVMWEVIQDFAPLYDYTDGFNTFLQNELPPDAVKCRSPEEALNITKDESNDNFGVYPVRSYVDANGNIFNEFQIGKCVVALNRVHMAALIKEGKYPVIRCNLKPADHVVEYKFTRIRFICGEKKTVEVKSKFTVSDAIAAELYNPVVPSDKKPGTYNKYLRIMIAIRAFTYGAREIASDILLGAMELEELNAIVNGTANDNVNEDMETTYTDYDEIP